MGGAATRSARVSVKGLRPKTDAAGVAQGGDLRFGQGGEIGFQGSRLTWNFSGGCAPPEIFKRYSPGKSGLGVTENHAALFFAPDDLGQAAGRGVHGGAAVAGIQGAETCNDSPGWRLRRTMPDSVKYQSHSWTMTTKDWHRGRLLQETLRGMAWTMTRPRAEGFFDDQGGAAFGAEQDGNGFVVAGVKLMAAENADVVNVQAMGVGQQGRWRDDRRRAGKRR